MKNNIIVKGAGAREHNLKNIDVEFPTTDKKEFLQCIEKRGYHKPTGENWM
jgi:excinuclease UvrABC ATPase subunit